MNKFTKNLTNIFKRGGVAFTCFPAAMGFAILMAGLNIWLVIAQPTTMSKLSIILQFTFATASLLGIALSVFVRKMANSKPQFTIYNLLTVAYAIIVFLIMYFVGGTDAQPSIRITLVIVAIGALSLISFIVIPTYHSTLIDYNKMFFMTLKSFFVAVFYSLVLMGGFSFVAYAVQQLLWSDMTNKVYMTIVILSLLIGYAFFLGYFPNFKQKEDEEFSSRSEIAFKQPRFAEILFQNIMVPIHTALSVVLLAWSIRIVVTREWPSYGQVVGIFTAYSLFSIFLYLLISSYDTNIVRWYRRVVPIATLVFLAFEVYPIYLKIAQSGIQPLEYVAICVWVFAAIVSVCFIFVTITQNRIAAYVAAALIILSVLPFVGAMDASYYSQSFRLESTLKRNDMLKDGKITPLSAINENDKIVISVAVNYLYSDVDKEAPEWISSQLKNTNEFDAVFGFSQQFYPIDNNNGNNNPLLYLFLRVIPGTVNIAGYNTYIPFDAFYNTNKTTVTSGGITYVVSYIIQGGKNGAPTVKVSKEETTLLEVDLNNFATTLFDKYHATVVKESSKGDEIKLSNEELSTEISDGGVTIKIFVESVQFQLAKDGAVNSVTLDIKAICVK